MHKLDGIYRMLTNNREISDTKPSDYFKIIEANLGDKLSLVLESNFISQEGFEAGKVDNYGLFISERTRLLQDKILTLVDEEVL